MIVDLSQFGKRLQGKIAGKKHYAKLCGIMADVQPGELVFLDFDGVENANGSWINAAISPLFSWSANDQNDFFPVLTRFPKRDLDELELAAKVNQQCYPVASATSSPVQSLLLVGPLDESLRITLTKLGELGESTGAELFRQVPNSGIQATGWNNRLKDLFDRRLLYRRKEGREQIYFPIAKKIEHYG